eukprot:2231268-Prymnesium_polylepis.1
MRPLHGKVLESGVQGEIRVQIREMSAIEHLDDNCQLWKQRNVHHAGTMRPPENVGLADDLGLVRIRRSLKDGSCESIARFTEYRPLQPAERL